VAAYAGSSKSPRIAKKVAPLQKSTRRAALYLLIKTEKRGLWPYTRHVVDDHAVMRKGLSLLLSRNEDIDVVAEAADGVQGVEMAQRINPDVILMEPAHAGHGRYRGDPANHFAAIAYANHRPFHAWGRRSGA